MSSSKSRPPAWSRLLVVPFLAVCLIALAGCHSSSEPKTPEKALAAAKKTLDATSGVSINLRTDKLPDGVDGVTDATGLGTHAPAFEGKLTAVVNHLTVTVPVVSVDGNVYLKLPFTTKFVSIDPSDYGAPDPAGLMDPTGGISSWLTAATGVKKTGQTRNGSTVLTSYTGTLPGKVVAAVIPSAKPTGQFPVTFHIDDKDQLAGADISGPFYGDMGTVDYTLTLDNYGTSKTIKKP
jgi:lipoprotein LprG